MSLAVAFIVAFVLGGWVAVALVALVVFACVWIVGKVFLW